ncbi:MAG: hypothetical protein AAB549_01010 [Patescibacteria group bacterium]
MVCQALDAGTEGLYYPPITNPCQPSWRNCTLKEVKAVQSNTLLLQERRLQAAYRKRVRLDKRVLRLLFQRIGSKTAPNHEECFVEGDYRAKLGVVVNSAGSFCCFFESDLGKPRAGQEVRTQAPS